MMMTNCGRDNASARVIVDTLVDAEVVPSAAVRRSTTGTFVYLVDKDNRASVRPVSVLLQEESYAVIGDGLDLEVRVITLGFDQLKDGKAVRIVQDNTAPATEQRVHEPTRERPEGGERHRRKDRDPSNPSVKPARATKAAVRFSSPSISREHSP